MKQTLVVFVVVAAMACVGEAVYAYSKLGNFYYYTEPMETAMQRVHHTAARSVRPEDGTPSAYQKYVACVARTFFFQSCTLCFCTDVPNVALCWDYAADRCAETRRLVEQQLYAHNNNPNGVW